MRAKMNKKAIILVSLLGAIMEIMIYWVFDSFFSDLDDVALHFFLQVMKLSIMIALLVVIIYLIIDLIRKNQ